jgi:hypothetical protein
MDCSPTHRFHAAIVIAKAANELERRRSLAPTRITTAPITCAVAATNGAITPTEFGKSIYRSFL